MANFPKGKWERVRATDAASVTGQVQIGGFGSDFAGYDRGDFRGHASSKIGSVHVLDMPRRARSFANCSFAMISRKN